MENIHKSEEEARASMKEEKTKKISLVTFSPLLIVIALSLVFLVFHDKDSSKTASPLVGEALPTFSAPPLAGFAEGETINGFSSTDFQGGEVKLLNVWASWCVPCRQEHALLVALDLLDGLAIYGLNYKDQASNANAFLDELGNPFRAIGTDIDGRLGVDLGVYGIPETYVVRGDGVIAYKHVGPITERILESKIRPEIAKARAHGR